MSSVFFLFMQLNMIKYYILILTNNYESTRNTKTKSWSK